MKWLLHRLAFALSILIPLSLSVCLFVIIPQSVHPDVLLNSAKLFWFSGAVFVLTNAIGLLLYGSPWHKEQKTKRDYIGWNPVHELVICYVSRGDNAIALSRAIAASKLVLEDMGVQYRIEAVTDMPVNAGADDHIIVPDDYHTPNGAKYKARALHYAATHRRARRARWVLHMDEESIVTPELVRGLADFYDSVRSPFVIGQGEIKYNAYNYGKNLLITAIDAIRTGDDLGRFRLQYKLFNRPLFGMHGSFFVVNSLLERKIGFDLGGKGSITEDAYFALVCADIGVHFTWVDGFIREQSPFTITALLKQRRRWITGLRLLMWDKTISGSQRFMLGLNMLLWRLAWIGPVVTIWNFIAGGSMMPPLAVLGSALVSGMVGVVYMVGAYRNVTGCGMAFSRQLLIWVSAGILVPLSCIIEGIAVIYSIVRPVKVFEVVSKN